ncbi:MAG: class I SAM-dependent rRNA methyltransferase [Chloroflexi bacterium]|nr:class I SAM-dependent rRNA methyltransferase [Chloroflexota bacterium]
MHRFLNQTGWPCTTPAAERAVRQGHPWVYENGIRKQKGNRPFWRPRHPLRP